MIKALGNFDKANEVLGGRDPWSLELCTHLRRRSGNRPYRNANLAAPQRCVWVYPAQQLLPIGRSAVTDLDHCLNSCAGVRLAGHENCRASPVMCPTQQTENAFQQINADVTGIYGRHSAAKEARSKGWMPHVR